MREDEFERLYTEHARPLLGFLIYRTSDVDLAEDVLSETFERVFRARNRFDRRKASEKTWIYSIALNRLRDHARRKGAEARALESVGPPPEQAAPLSDALETKDMVLRALKVLTADQRETVALRYGAGMTVPEIAKVLGVPRTTVEKRLSRAVQELRTELG